MNHELVLWQARFGDFLQLQGFSARTVEGYRQELRWFFEFLAGQGVVSLGAVSLATLEAYRAQLFFEVRPHGRTLSPRTQERRLSAVKTFFRFLVREHYLVVNPARELEMPRTPRGLPRTLLSEEEVLTLLEAAEGSDPVGIRNRTLLEVFYATALRNSELAQLRLEEIDLTRHEIRLRRGKGRKGRVIPLGEEALQWLQRYLTQARPELVASPQEPRLFVNAQGGPLSRQSLSALVRQLAERAGLEKRVTPHTLRHACATHMLRHGAGLRHLQKFLGHASVGTTQRYTHLEVSDLREVLLRCHPRERG